MSKWYDKYPDAPEASTAVVDKPVAGKWYDKYPDAPAPEQAPVQQSSGTKWYDKYPDAPEVPVGVEIDGKFAEGVTISEGGGTTINPDAPQPYVPSQRMQIYNPKWDIKRERTNKEYMDTYLSSSEDVRDSLPVNLTKLAIEAHSSGVDPYRAFEQAVFDNKLIVEEYDDFLGQYNRLSEHKDADALLDNATKFGFESVRNDLAFAPDEVKSLFNKKWKPIADRISKEQERSYRIDELARQLAGVGDDSNNQNAPASNALMRNLDSGLMNAATDLLSIAARATGHSKWSDDLSVIQSQASAYREKMNEGSLFGKDMANSIAGATRTLTESMILAPTGQYGMTAGFGVITANNSYSEAINSGIQPDQALEYAIDQGIKEAGIAAIFNAVGKGGLEALMTNKISSSGGIKGFAKVLTKSLAGELPEELITEYMQAEGDVKYGLDPSALSPESLKERQKQVLLQTTMAVGGGSVVAARQDTGVVNESPESVVPREVTPKPVPVQAPETVENGSILPPDQQTAPEAEIVQPEDLTADKTDEGLTFQEFEKQYKEAFDNSMKYPPDQAGSKIYTEQMADLADKYPEWAEAVEEASISEATPTPPQAAAPTVAESATVEKQPWEMTKGDFAAVPRGEEYIELTRPFYKEIGGAPAVLSKDTHKAIIKEAIRRGKPVPAEVLADYPDLAAKQPPNKQVVEPKEAPAKGSELYSPNPAEALRRYEHKKGYIPFGTKKIRQTKKNRELIALAKSDTKYQQMIKKLKADRIKQGREFFKADRAKNIKEGIRAAKKGELNAELAAYVPIHLMDKDIGKAIQVVAETILDDTAADATKNALQKIIEDNGKDVGASVEKQKERIINILINGQPEYHKPGGMLAPDLAASKKLGVDNSHLDTTVESYAKFKESKPVEKKTDLFGNEIKGKTSGEQKDLGIGKGEVGEKGVGEVLIKPKLLQEANKQILGAKFGMDNAKDLWMAIQHEYKADADKLFNNPSSPMPELKEAFLQATKGKSLFASPAKALGGGRLSSPNYAGEQNEIDRGRIKVDMEPKGKSVSAREIIEEVGRSFDVPIRGRATHVMRNALGWYDIKAKGVRLKDVRAITTAIHEIGHYIDRSLNNSMSRKPPSKAIADELMALGKDLYGSRKPAGGYKSEGWAEFIREYVTGEDAQVKAPEIYKWFTEEYLKSKPDIAKKINRIKGMVTNWRGQGAEARVDSQINKKPIKGKVRDRLSKGLLWLDMNLRDELAPLRRGLRKAGIKEGDLSPGSDPLELARAYQDKAGAKARQFVLDHTTNLAGESTGMSLRSVLKPVSKDIDNFTKWAVSARSLLLHKRGINPGISKADAKYVYDKYDSKKYQQVLKDMTEWNDRILDYLVEAGGLTESASKQMRSLNPIYLPFMRAFAKGEIRGGGVGKKLASAGKAIKKITGSGREIIDPLEAMIQQTEKIISTAQKTDIARSLVNIAKTKEGVAGLIWEVPAPTQATKASAEQLKKDILKIAVNRLGLDPSEINSGILDQWDEVLTVYSNASQYYGKDNIVSLVVDGERRFFEVAPEMFTVLEGMDSYHLPWFIDFVLGKPNRMVRLGATGLNASFGLIRNLIRDAATFSVLAKHAKLGPISAATGVIKDIVRTGDAQKFKALGGKMSSQVLYDRVATQHLRGEALSNTVGDYVIKTAKHPIDALRELFGLTEAGTRIGEFGPALKYGEEKWGKGSKDAAIYALNQAQDVTTNFTRHGRIAKVINQMIPFFNAAIQGPDKMIRTFASRPAATSLKAIAYLTIPAILLWWRNKDEDWYKNLPAYEKANYLHFKIPGTDMIIRMPVPFELGHIFQSIPIAAINSWYSKNPDEVKAVVAEAARRANPLDWPAAIGPAIDILQNKDFADRPIVPKRLEGKLPEDQVKPYTSELMKYIGKGIKVSPTKLEYLANSYSGGLYTRSTRSMNWLGKKIGMDGSETTASDWPVIGTLFVRDSYAPKAQIEAFYERLDELEQKNQSKKITISEKIERMKLVRIRKALGVRWEQLRAAKTETRREAIYNQIKMALGEGDYLSNAIEALRNVKNDNYSDVRKYIKAYNENKPADAKRLTIESVRRSLKGRNAQYRRKYLNEAAELVLQGKDPQPVIDEYKSTKKKGMGYISMDHVRAKARKIKSQR